MSATTNVKISIVSKPKGTKNHNYSLRGDERQHNDDEHVNRKGQQKAPTRKISPSPYIPTDLNRGTGHPRTRHISHAHPTHIPHVRPVIKAERMMESGERRKQRSKGIQGLIPSSSGGKQSRRNKEKSKRQEEESRRRYHGFPIDLSL